MFTSSMSVTIVHIVSMVVILFSNELIITNAQECDTLPSDSTLENNLLSLLISEAGEDPSINPNLLTVLYTCMAQGMTMGSYREVSVIVTYNNVANSPQSRQFDLECVSGGGGTLGWQGIGGSLDFAPSGFETLETRTNCSQCRRNANNDYDCVACHPDCNIGLMRCTGTGSDDCCPLFDNGQCAEMCSQVTFAANEQNNFICSCALICEPGQVLDPNCSRCILINICEAETPCDNNGVCILGFQPDEYTCNCTNTGYTGTNCTVCGLSCEPGYAPDPSCSICVLINICEAEMPCENNGVCILGSQPDEYRCNCTNTGFTGTNCTVTQSICQIEDAMVITPFPQTSIPSPSYNYHGSCEHVLTRQCGLQSIFTINVDHNPDNLELSRVGIRLNQSFIIITENLTYNVMNLGDPIFRSDQSVMYGDDVLIELDINVTSKSLMIYLIDLGISLELTRDLVNSSNTLTLDATNYNSAFREICGLCGTLEGNLLYSDGKTLLLSRNMVNVEDFALSWRVTPENQIVREGRRECGALGNDTIVGDPLFTVPLYLRNNRLKQVSLCYEIHGAVNKVFNLVSDRCVSVNAMYISMNNPDLGNVISTIGVKAVDNKGRCIDIVVSLSEQCIPLVDSQPLMYYNKYGISVIKRNSQRKVSLSVPNCENEQLVMWILCKTIAGQELIDFEITRGLNLRPTSHGLIGQFWNIPVNVTSYHTELPEIVRDYYNPENLFLVTVDNPISTRDPRQFIGELVNRSWDNSPISCLYVGNSQGGRLRDIPGPRDSVIEGRYTDYRVSDGLLGSDFMYSQFDTDICY